MIHCQSYAHTESSTPVTHPGKKLHMGVHAYAVQRTAEDSLFSRLTTSPKPTSFLGCSGGQVSGIPSCMPPSHRAKGKFRDHSPHTLYPAQATEELAFRVFKIKATLNI